jgi:hypothetical protein
MTWTDIKTELQDLPKEKLIDLLKGLHNTLLNMFERFVVELKMSPARRELYSFFRDRLMKMRATSDIGWGYGDEIQWNVDELEKSLSA